MDDAAKTALALVVVRDNRYLVLSTADAEGRPWVSPVYFAADGLRTFYWVSRPGAEHSANLAARPDVALVVFDSTQPVNTGVAVYARARAEQVPAAEVDTVVGTYSRRSEADDGAGAWDRARIEAAGLALYRAVATELSLLTGDGPDIRVTVTP